VFENIFPRRYMFVQQELKSVTMAEQTATMM
jgi:hypothetical protein